MNTRALVTGAGGFIGRAVMNRLSAARIEAISLGSRPAAMNGHTHIQMEFPARPEILSSILHQIQPDMILHLAAAPPGADAATHRDITQDFAFALFESAEKTVPHARIVTLGSAAEFGTGAQTHRAMTEADLCAPVSAYGQAKYHVTREAERRWKNGQNMIAARLFTAFGPDMPLHTALGHAAHQIHAQPDTGGTLSMGDLNVERDYLDVDEVAAIIVQLAGGAARDIPLVHIASGKSFHLGRIVEDMIRLSGKKFNISQAKAPSLPIIPKIYGAPELLHKSGLFPKIADNFAIAHRIICS